MYRPVSLWKSAPGRAIGFSLTVMLVPLLSAQPERIQGLVDANRTGVLVGHINPRIRAGRDEGPVPPGLRIGPVTLILNRSEAQQAALNRLLDEQRQPSSPLYRHWLSPDEFADRFGFNAGDIRKITGYLESQGLTVEGVARSRAWVTFSGSAAQVSKALGTAIHYYQAGAVRHYANVSEPSLPLALQKVALGFEGLTSLRPKPALPPAQAAPRDPSAAAASCDATAMSGKLTPANFKAIYNVAKLAALPSPIDGSGQTIAVVGEVDPSMTPLFSDVNAFRAHYDLPATTIKAAAAPSPGSLSVDPRDLRESDLDLEWAGAVAPKAQLVYAYARSAFVAARSVIDQKLATVISMSYGTCEPDASGIEPAFYQALAQQGNAEGITWVAASGDSGPAACDVHGVNPEATNGPAVWFPASIPEVTGVGGTEFAETLSSPSSGCYWSSVGSAAGYIPEQAWNDTGLYNTLLASGGGPSKIYTTKPFWQLGLGDTARDVPDVAFAASGAHDPYQIFFNNGAAPESEGGTSAAAPSFAGIVALLNQSVNPQSSSAAAGLGNINPRLYALAQSRPQVFHDITVGNNIVPCASGSAGCPTAATAAKTLGFLAQSGYDQVTGLGSVDAYALTQAWGPGRPTTISVAALPAAYQVGDQMQLMATVSAGSGSGLPSGQVAFMALQPAFQNQLPADPIPLSSSPLSSATGTITAAATPFAALLPMGPSTIQAVYSGDAFFEGSAATTTVTLSASLKHSSVVAAASDPVTESPAAAGGYNWKCKLTLSNLSTVPTTVTKFVVSGIAGALTGLDLSGSISALFGSAAVPGSATLVAEYATDSITPPTTLTFSFGGTDADGTAWKAMASAVFDGPPRAITSIANGASFDPVRIPVGSSNPPPDAPVIQQSVFAPGMALTVFSTNGGLAGFTATSPLPLPSVLTSSDGSSYLSATINNTAASLYFVSPAQVDLQIPYEMQASFSPTVTSFPAVLVLDNNGVMSSYSLTMAPVAPGIFADNGIWNLTSDSQQPVNPNSQGNPAPAGSMVAVYYTGAGALSGAVVDGNQSVPSTPVPLSKVTLTLAGNGISPLIFSNATPANNVAAAMTPGTVGVAQAAFRLPSNLLPGEYRISIALQGTVGSGSSLTTLPGPITGNAVSVWVGPCTSNCSN